LIFKETLKDYVYISSIIFIIIFIPAIFIIPQIFGNIYKPVSSDELRMNSINSPFTTKFPHLIINNIIISIILIGVGIFGQKLLPSFILSYNTLFIGEGISMLNRPETFGAIYSMIPHGIIEIPTIILCTAFSYRFAYQMQTFTGNKGIIGILSYKEPINSILYTYAIIPYIKYILPLLILSTFIECTISIYILKAIFNGV
jgi:uncharacterized membrane protein SpoIIM required for sporulation